MSDQQRIRELLEEIFETNRSPEEVCAADPDLLPEVRARWERMRRVDHEIRAFFPAVDATRLEPGTRPQAKGEPPRDGRTQVPPAAG